MSDLDWVKDYSDFGPEEWREQAESFRAMYRTACKDRADMFDEVKAQADRIAKLEAALRNVMIGGNHVALLIGADHPPYTATCADALTHYGVCDAYEAWCCWQTIMHAREDCALS